MYKLQKDDKIYYVKKHLKCDATRTTTYKHFFKINTD